MTKGRDLKPHIGIFGRRNVGKSSFINAITGAEVSIVSEIPGTTTDPVKKSIEIFGIGPAIIIDTAGIDDIGELGNKRIDKTFQVIKNVDCAILIISENNFGEYENLLIENFNKYDIPYFIVHNKEDKEKLISETEEKIKRNNKDVEIIRFSAVNRENLEGVIELIKKTIPETSYQKPTLLGGIINKNDVVLLVTPIDSEAPEGRMILPQVMAIRDVLDNDAICVVLKETELEYFFSNIELKPKLVVTDSQVFHYVSKIVPRNIWLTSFSILFARMRGPFEKFIDGVKKLSSLKDGDKVLILESCTHQISCDDIGRFKLPKWILSFSGKKVTFDVVAGLNEINLPITEYSLIIQCGACMITRKQLFNRLKVALEEGVSVTNYGIAIAYMNGILDRVLEPFIKQ